MIPVVIIDGTKPLHGGRVLRYCTPEGVPQLVTAVAERGGYLWGAPGRVSGATVKGIGVVYPIDAIARELHGEDPTAGAIGQAVLALRQVSGNHKAGTGGAAALAAIIRDEGRDQVRSTPEVWRPVMVDSTHAGPVEWRSRVRLEGGHTLTYLDQVSAYLWALERGVPDSDHGWSRVDARGMMRALEDPESWCLVATVEVEAKEPYIPLKRALWGPVTMPIGRYITTVRGPILRAAVDGGAAKMTRFGGAAVCPRRRWDRLTETLRSLLEHEPWATKIVYQRIWGRLLSQGGLSGFVRPAVTEAEPDAAVTSVELGERGEPVTVTWRQNVIRDYGHRPDVAGEITAHAYARTAGLALQYERGGVDVPLLHVDAVVTRSRVQAVPPGWSVKGQGHGAVYGHGRYAIDHGDGTWKVGRMGLAEGEPLRHADPDEWSEASCSSRDWDGDSSTPIVCDGDRQHESGCYPWHRRHDANDE